jgi:glycosyltransferase involved in cell wall biosynthesis
VRVAFVTTEYPTETWFAGGLASYVHRTATALLAHGHDAEVFTLSTEDARLRHDGLLVHRVDHRRERWERVGALPYLWRYAGLAYVGIPAWRLARAVRRRHREAAFDVVQASNYRACGLDLAWRPVAPLLTRLSTYEPLWREAYRRPPSRRQAQIERAEMSQIRRSAAVYAPSRLIADVVRRLEGVEVHLIEPPFALNATATLAPPPWAPAAGTYGLFFGSIGLLKGCDRLASALPRVLDRNPDMRFVFVGSIRPGEDGRPFSEAITARLGRYAARVIVMPEQRSADLLPVVANARFVALPSRVDNLPNACLEAMALGRVVVATHHASFDQLVTDGASGLLVSQEDDAELADAMERAWRMPPVERERMGGRARESLERLRPEHAIPRLVELFEEVRAGGPRPARRLSAT